MSQSLHDRLPDHMIPSLYVWRESLPLNRQGKTDREALVALALPPLSRQ